MTLFEYFISNTYTTTLLQKRFGFLQKSLEVILYTVSTEETAHTVHEKFLSQVRENSTEPETTFFTSIPPELINSVTTKNLHVVLSQLQKEIDSYPTTILYVPTAFTDDAVALLEVWARKELKRELLFDIHVDPSMVGGCGFVHNDVYHDYALPHFMKREPGIVTQLLSSYETSK
jgi:hypothetical protein